MYLSIFLIWPTSLQSQSQHCNFHHSTLLSTFFSFSIYFSLHKIFINLIKQYVNPILNFIISISQIDRIKKIFNYPSHYYQLNKQLKNYYFLITILEPYLQETQTLKSIKLLLTLVIKTILLMKVQLVCKTSMNIQTPKLQNYQRKLIHKQICAER